MIRPPPGFEIIQDTAPPSLPPGFEMESSPATGYMDNLKQMATEGAEQFAGGMDQLSSAFRFAASGAGRNVVPDTPSNRVAGGFSALDPSGPQAPLTEVEHSAANRQSAGNVARGFGNVVFGGLGAIYSPINAALRTYVGEPVEKATGIPKEIPEFVAGMWGPSAISRGVRSIGRIAAHKPTGEQIQAAAVAGFESPAITRLEIQPVAVQAWSQGLQQNLTSGLGPRVAPKTWGILDDLNNAPAGSRTTGFDLQALRQNLANVAKERGPDFNATPDAAAATRSIEWLDRFVAGGIRPRDVISGNPAAAATAWREAQGNYGQYAKIRAADRRQLQAEGNTASANSGLNFDNTMRQKLRDVATTPAGRGFTQPGERAAVNQVVRGSPERNALRLASAILGGGGGLGSVVAGAVGAGAGTALTGGVGGAAGALLPAAGMGLRLIQNAMAARDMDKLNAVLRANSPLARQQGGRRQDLARSLMSADLTQRQRNLIASQLLSRPAPFTSP